MKDTSFPTKPAHDRPKMAVVNQFNVYKATAHGIRIRCQYPTRYKREDWMNQCPCAAVNGQWFCGSHKSFAEQGSEP